MRRSQVLCTAAATMISLVAINAWAVPPLELLTDKQVARFFKGKMERGLRYTSKVPQVRVSILAAKDPSNRVLLVENATFVATRGACRDGGFKAGPANWNPSNIRLEVPVALASLLVKAAEEGLVVSTGLSPDGFCHTVARLTLSTPTLTISRATTYGHKGRIIVKEEGKAPVVWSRKTAKTGPQSGELVWRTSPIRAYHSTLESIGAQLGGKKRLIAHQEVPHMDQWQATVVNAPAQMIYP